MYYLMSTDYPVIEQNIFTEIECFIGRYIHMYLQMYMYVFFLLYMSTFVFSYRRWRNIICIQNKRWSDRDVSFFSHSIFFDHIWKSSVICNNKSQLDNSFILTNSLLVVVLFPYFFTVEYSWTWDSPLLECLMIVQDICPSSCCRE